MELWTSHAAPSFAKAVSWGGRERLPQAHLFLLSFYLIISLESRKKMSEATACAYSIGWPIPDLLSAHDLSKAKPKAQE